MMRLLEEDRVLSIPDTVDRLISMLEHGHHGEYMLALLKLLKEKVSCPNS